MHKFMVAALVSAAILGEGLILGLVGVQSLLVIGLFFILPVFVILSNFDLALEELIFFSCFLGVGLFPIVVWVFNKFIPSFRMSAIIVLVLACIVAFAIRVKGVKGAQ